MLQTLFYLEGHKARLRLLDIITIWTGLGNFLRGPSNNEYHARLRMREGENYADGKLYSFSILEHHLRLQMVMDKSYFLVTFMGGTYLEHFVGSMTLEIGLELLYKAQIWSCFRIMNHFEVLNF